MNRDKFVYRLENPEGKSYGFTTDVYTLPVGTKFVVENGFWSGEIVEIDGKKYIEINDIFSPFGNSENGRLLEIKEDVDYSLVITIEQDEVEKESSTYQHYKGGIYEKLYEAKHTEEEETLVIYKDEKDNIWARPKEMFDGYLEYEGQTVKRFSVLK